MEKIDRNEVRRKRARHDRAALKNKRQADIEHRDRRHQEERENNPEKFKHKPRPNPEKWMRPNNIEFAQIPFELLIGPDKLSTSCLALYGYINSLTRKHGCYQTYLGIAGALYMSVETVKAGVKKLKQLGLIHEEPYPDELMRNKMLGLGMKLPASGRTLKAVPWDEWAVVKRFAVDEDAKLRAGLYTDYMQEQEQGQQEQEQEQGEPKKKKSRSRRTSTNVKQVEELPATWGASSAFNKYRDMSPQEVGKLGEKERLNFMELYQALPENEKREYDEKFGI